MLFITAGAVDRPVAEATVGWMLALTHHFRMKDRLVREARWDERSQYVGSELRDRTLGVICFGGGQTKVAGTEYSNFSGIGSCYLCYGSIMFALNRHPKNRPQTTAVFSSTPISRRALAIQMVSPMDRTRCPTDAPTLLRFHRRPLERRLSPAHVAPRHRFITHSS